MAIADLLTNTCTITRRAESGTVDAFGNDVPEETTETGVDCELQQAQRSEPSEHGEVSVARWRLFLPAGTDIRTGDAVTVDTIEYEVVGDPWPARNPVDQSVSHVEVDVQLTRGAEDAS